jgi:hypothetical protein
MHGREIIDLSHLTLLPTFSYFYTLSCFTNLIDPNFLTFLSHLKLLAHLIHRHNPPESPESCEPPETIWPTKLVSPAHVAHLTLLLTWPTLPLDPHDCQALLNQIAPTGHLLPWPNMTHVIYVTYLTHPMWLTCYPKDLSDLTPLFDWNGSPGPLGGHVGDLPETLGPPYLWASWPPDPPSCPTCQKCPPNMCGKKSSRAIEYGHL